MIPRFLLLFCPHVSSCFRRSTLIECLLFAGQGIRDSDSNLTRFWALRSPSNTPTRPQQCDPGQVISPLCASSTKTMCGKKERGPSLGQVLGLDLQCGESRVQTLALLPLPYVAGSWGRRLPSVSGPSDLSYSTTQLFCKDLSLLRSQASVRSFLWDPYLTCATLPARALDPLHG